MRFSVLGSSGSYCSPGSPCSSYLIEEGGKYLLLDAGNGSMTNLFQFCQPSRLDAVFLSHEHADHWVDVVGIYHYRLFADNSGGEIPLIAPRSLIARLKEQLHTDDFGGVFRPFELEETPEFALGAIEATFVKTYHPVSTYAVSVSGSSSRVVYSADTGPNCIDLEMMATSADLLVAECTWGSAHIHNGAPIHLSPSDFAALLKSAGPGRALVTHIAHPQSRAEVLRDIREVSATPVELAVDGSTLNV